ncbi:MAG TPA: hypothetical protein QF753_04950 [Victivallales bacterium]|nr:hypothetical protein [Victivallales bacterium]
MKTDHIYNTAESLILLVTSIICIVSFVAYSVLHLLNYSAMSYRMFLHKPAIMLDHQIITYFCFISLLILLYFSLKGFWKCRKNKPVFFIVFVILFLLAIFINNPIEEYLYLNSLISGQIIIWDGFNFIGIAAVASFAFSVLHYNYTSN